ncbi:MAG TPA: replication protein [Candidatus Omnitrophota bacterium]|nr:replication protein [Candidatus Omnitrophota bacterium]
MANPQVEDGHIDIANEIAEHLCRYRISGEEWMVLWAIIRKTYGWRKKEDRIALSQFAAMTGLKRQTALRAINKLSSKKIIVVIKNDDSQINTYRFNKDFDTWEPLSKKITLSSKKITTVTKKDNQVSSKKIHTKDNSTKDTLTKDNTPMPPWVPEAVFNEYQASRKKKLRPASFKKFFAKLQRLSIESRASPEDILNQSIENGWEGIFKLKNDNGTGKNKHAGIKEWLDQQGVSDGAEGQKEIRGTDGGDG